MKTVCCWVDTLVAHSFLLVSRSVNLGTIVWRQVLLGVILSQADYPTYKVLLVLRRCIVNRERDLLGLLGTSVVNSTRVKQLLLSIHYLASKATV